MASIVSKITRRCANRLARNGLLFYELDIDDPMGTTPFKRTDATTPDGTFEGQINQLALFAYTAGLNYKDKALSASKDSNTIQKRGTFIPDGYG